MTRPSWDDTFMSMTYLVSMRSKDPATHLGAVIIGPNNEVISTGYNSFPRGINDDIPERQERPEKYKWIEHAERNAIFNAATIGVPLRGCTIYTSGTPCMDCARAIVQSGIKEVVVDKSWDDANPPQWEKDAINAKQLFKEAGVTIRFWDGKIIEIKKFRGGKFVD